VLPEPDSAREVIQGHSFWITPALPARFHSARLHSGGECRFAGGEGAQRTDHGCQKLTLDLAPARQQTAPPFDQVRSDSVELACWSGVPLAIHTFKYPARERGACIARRKSDFNPSVVWLSGLNY
jgi:hypothetical protein